MTTAAEGATEPNVRCPFTGTLIRIFQVGGGAGWVGEVALENFGYITRIFPNKQELIYELSTRDGVKPRFPRSTVTEPVVRTPQVSEVAKELAAQSKSTEADDDRIANEAAGKILAERNARVRAGR